MLGMYPVRSLRLTRDELKDLLVWCAERDVSDVTLKSGEPVMAKSHGIRQRISDRPLTTPEIGDLLNGIYGANGTTTLAGASAIDTSYDIKHTRDTRFRFRVNATSCDFEGGPGIEITLRSIKSMPPSIEEMNLEPAIMEALSPALGLILVTGETGSGKSTLLSSIIRWRVEQEHANLKVLTGEAPIEYVYDDVIKPSSIVTQTELPKHLHGTQGKNDFAEFVRNSLRRDPDIILVGESRDAETIGASLEASMTGHLVYSTVHSNSVDSTIRRMMATFPEGERNGRAVDIVENLRLVVTQRLLRSVDGKRVPIREYLVFDDEVRDKLLGTHIDQLPMETRRLTLERGQTLVNDARKKLEEGRIHEREFNAIAALSKSQEADLMQGVN